MFVNKSASFGKSEKLLSMESSNRIVLFYNSLDE